MHHYLTDPVPLALKTHKLIIESPNSDFDNQNWKINFVENLGEIKP